MASAAPSASASTPIPTSSQPVGAVVLDLADTPRPPPPLLEERKATRSTRPRPLVLLSLLLLPNALLLLLLLLACRRLCSGLLMEARPTGPRMPPPTLM
jgi:hypothetical protein